MKSKSLSRGSVPASSTISLLICGTLAAQPAPPKTPAIALLNGAEAPQWQNALKEAGWRLIAPPPPSGQSGPSGIDLRVLALAAAVQAAIQDSAVDPDRVYLAGRAEDAAGVFYAISRVPDLWAAAVALGGSPQTAVDTNRLFTANFANTPILWAGGGAGDQELAEKLSAAGLKLEWRAPSTVPNTALFEWLAGHRRNASPFEIDCETNSPNFARCYWIQMTKFDSNARNDVLPSTLLAPTVSAWLDLGGFVYKAGEPGPGVLVSLLPPKYNGPLKTYDRIVELDGRPIADARAYAAMMAAITEDRPAVVMVERGKDRVRIETRVRVPRHEALATARVQARYDPEEKEILIISRAVTEMRVTIPPAWVPADLSWNGLALEGLKVPGCYLLTVEKELLHAAPCQ